MAAQSHVRQARDRPFPESNIARACRVMAVVLQNFSGNDRLQDTESGVLQYVATYPDNANGAVLSDLAAEGVDMTAHSDADVTWEVHGVPHDSG